MKRSKAHQDAVDMRFRAERDALAYHHALKAEMNDGLIIVGSVKENDDRYVWRIAFSPRQRDAVIVETVGFKAGDNALRVFWLEDMGAGIKYASIDFQTLYSKAMQLQNAEWNKSQVA